MNLKPTVARAIATHYLKALEPDIAIVLLDGLITETMKDHQDIDPDVTISDLIDDIIDLMVIHRAKGPDDAAEMARLESRKLAFLTDFYVRMKADRKGKFTALEKTCSTVIKHLRSLWNLQSTATSIGSFKLLCCIYVQHPHSSAFIFDEVFAKQIETLVREKSVPLMEIEFWLKLEMPDELRKIFLRKVIGSADQEQLSQLSSVAMKISREQKK